MNEVHVLIEVRNGSVVWITGPENLRVALFDRDNFGIDPQYFLNEEGSVAWFEPDGIMTKEEIIDYVTEEVKQYGDESNGI